MRRRIIVAAVAPAVIGVLGCWLVISQSSGRLPEELATHWNGSGIADGFSSLRSYLVTTAAIAVLSWVGATALALLLGPHLREMTGFATSLPGAVVGFFTTMTVTTVIVNRDVAAVDASLSLWAVNLPVAGLLVGGIAGAWLAGPAPRSKAGRPAAGVTAAGGAAAGGTAAGGTDAAPGEVLSVTQTWRGAAWMAVALALFGLILAVVAKLVVVLLLAPVMLAFSRYHLTIGPRGLAVSGALFGWPSIAIPLEEIQGAQVVEVRPFRQWGGWGLRLRLDGSRGLITQSGPGVEVSLSDGRSFVATVAEPDRVVELTERLVARVAS